MVGKTGKTPHQSPTLGILKMGPIRATTGGTRKHEVRTGVLTSAALHWYKKADKEIFGSEKGCVKLEEIASIGWQAKDPTSNPRRGSLTQNPLDPPFLLIETQTRERYFVNADTEEACREWHEAIQEARQRLKQETLKRGLTLSGIDLRSRAEPSVMGVSIGKRSEAPTEASQGTSQSKDNNDKQTIEEILVRRRVKWMEEVLIPVMSDKQAIKVTIDDGSVGEIAFSEMQEAAVDSDTKTDLTVPLMSTDGQVFEELHVELRKVSQSRLKSRQAQNKTSSHAGKARRGSFILTAPSGSTPSLTHQLATAGLSLVCLVSLTLAALHLLHSADQSSCDSTQTLAMGSVLETDDSSPQSSRRGLLTSSLASALMLVDLTRPSGSPTMVFPHEQIQAMEASVCAVCGTVSLCVLAWTVAVVRASLLGNNDASLESLSPLPTTRGPVVMLKFIGIESAQDDIPSKFVEGCFHDMREARRRWNITKRWREVNNIDDILDKPQPYFDLIKECYPHFWLCRSRAGSCIYVEQSGKIDTKRLLSQGLSVDDIVHYYVFLTEYTWRVLNKEESGPQSFAVSVFDIQNFQVKNLMGENSQFLKKTSSIMSEHYPERAVNILIINTPSFFNILWNVASALVPEATKKKIRVSRGKNVGATFEEFADLSSIPEEYGGTCKVPVYDNEFETEYRKYVYELNERHGFKPPYDGSTAKGYHQTPIQQVSE